MAEDKKVKEAQARAESLMSQMNANPTIKVTEHFDAEGKMAGKDVEIWPRAASSVAFSVDSKGQVKPVVKVYHEDPYKALEVASDLIEKALAKALALSQIKSGEIEMIIGN